MFKKECNIVQFDLKSMAADVVDENLGEIVVMK